MLEPDTNDSDRELDQVMYLVSDSDWCMTQVFHHEDSFFLPLLVTAFFVFSASLVINTVFYLITNNCVD